MEPRIQYAKTSDGVRIAFFTLGEGQPLVSVAIAMAPAFTSSMSVPRWRDFNERLARRHKHVLYDARGTGLSDREAKDQSLGAWLLDIDAVVDRLGLPTFALHGSYAGCATAITYAARRPERVSHLILWNPIDYRAAFGPGTAAGDAFRKLFQTDWVLFTETTQRAWMGWEDSESGRLGPAAVRDSVTPEVFAMTTVTLYRVDLPLVSPHVVAPTLVLDRRRLANSPGSPSREIASAIPNAELVLFDGDSPLAYLAGVDDVVRVMEGFLGVGETEPTQAGLPAGTAIILFADIADSTALTERFGDVAFRDKSRQLDAGLRAVIVGAGGTPVEGKLLGDGLMAVFASASQAIEAARRCNTLSESTDLRLHLGLHAGDVIREEGNVYGGAVNIASRISGLSAPGEVLVSETVRSLARTSAGVRFEDRGEQALKGVGEPVRVWAVREGEAD